MSLIRVKGLGAVSPAGWTADDLASAVTSGVDLPVAELPRPGADEALKVRKVPAPATRPEFMAHPRFRRCSPVSHYFASACLEALRPDLERVQEGSVRLGLVMCTVGGCVNYSRRFFEEVLEDPATASPLIFPETVFNAPASHLSSYLGVDTRSYTLMGDRVAYGEALALGAGWLLADQVDGCLVVAMEELDWLVSGAVRLFTPQRVSTAGAGALYLVRGSDQDKGVRLAAVTSPKSFRADVPLSDTIRSVRDQLTVSGTAMDGLLCCAAGGRSRYDLAEANVWSDWKGATLRVRETMGEGFATTAAWQCVLAVHHLNAGDTGEAIVSLVHGSEGAIAVQFLGCAEVLT